MSLFMEYKSNLYKALCEIVNTAYFSQDKTITSREIERIKNKYACYEHYLNPIFNEIIPKSINKKTFLFEMVEDDGVSKYKLRIDAPLIPIITNSELIWLKSIMNKYMTRRTINNEAVNYLNEILAKTNDIITHNVLYKNYSQLIRKDKNNPVFDNLAKIARAIINKKLILFDYKTYNNIIFERQLAVPLKIEYSIKDDLFYLIAYIIKNNNVVKCAVHKLKNIEMDDEIKNIEEFYEREKEYLLSFKAPKPIVLEIKNQNNALERAFYLFSCFEKRAMYNEEKNVHVLYISYYKFEEAEIISRILSLGKNVVVTSPDEVRNEIIRRIKLALNNMK